MMLSIIKYNEDSHLLTAEELISMPNWEGQDINKAKEVLAFEVTKIVHGEQAALSAQNKHNSCSQVPEDLMICRQQN